MTPSDCVEFMNTWLFYNDRLFYVGQTLFQHYCVAISKNPAADIIIRELLRRINMFRQTLDTLRPDPYDSLSKHRTRYNKFWSKLKEFEAELNEDINRLTT